MLGFPLALGVNPYALAGSRIRRRGLSHRYDLESKSRKLRNVYSMVHAARADGQRRRRPSITYHFQGDCRGCASGMVQIAEKTDPLGRVLRIQSSLTEPQFGWTVEDGGWIRSARLRSAFEGGRILKESSSPCPMACAGVNGGNVAFRGVFEQIIEGGPRVSADGTDLRCP